MCMYVCVCVYVYEGWSVSLQFTHVHTLYPCILYTHASFTHRTSLDSIKKRFEQRAGSVENGMCV